MFAERPSFQEEAISKFSPLSTLEEKERGNASREIKDMEAKIVTAGEEYRRNHGGFQPKLVSMLSPKEEQIFNILGADPRSSIASLASAENMHPGTMQTYARWTYERLGICGKDRRYQLTAVYRNYQNVIKKK